MLYAYITNVKEIKNTKKKCRAKAQIGQNPKNVVATEEWKLETHFSTFCETSVSNTVIGISLKSP